MTGVDIKAELYRDFYLDRFHREGQPPTYQRRGSLQLWQFLVALLDDPANSAFIAWTGRGLEFKLIEPEEVTGFVFWPVVPRRFLGILCIVCPDYSFVHQNDLFKIFF